MSHILRPFEKGDEGSVKELILATLTKEYPFDRSAYSDSDLDRIEEVYGGEKDSFFVIDVDGKIVGTVGVKGESGSESLLRRLFVDSAHRNLGYGSELLDTAISFCRGKGYKKMYFRCTDRMVDAMNLCKRRGFIETDALEVSGFKIHKLELSI